MHIDINYNIDNFNDSTVGHTILAINCIYLKWNVIYM